MICFLKFLQIIRGINLNIPYYDLKGILQFISQTILCEFGDGKVLHSYSIKIIGSNSPQLETIASSSGCHNTKKKPRNWKKKKNREEQEG